ncbi:hypothetical protein [Natronococcus pandeyae]|uniref:hypothetical protein n=1 Tax=Natronococcus pandeyae TaxID=2055836 RepID=UPI0011E7B060|nr:hypothetical protein [Natronococcus pandeyae]
MAGALLLGVFLTILGLSMMVKSEWVGFINKKRISWFSNQDVENIELSEAWYASRQAAGLMIALTGLIILGAAV